MCEQIEPQQAEIQRPSAEDEQLPGKDAVGAGHSRCDAELNLGYLPYITAGKALDLSPQLFPQRFYTTKGPDRIELPSGTDARGVPSTLSSHPVAPPLVDEPATSGSERKIGDGYHLFSRLFDQLSRRWSR